MAPARPAGGPGALRLPVAALAVLAVLAVVGVFIWDGGDASTASPTPSGPGGGGTVDIGGGSSDSPGVAGGAGGTYNGEPYNPVPEPPLSQPQLAPPGGVQIPPTEMDASVAWRVKGGGGAVLKQYQENFPIEGYELGERRMTSGGGGGSWDVVAVGEGYQPASGELYIGPDPQDPSSTIVEYADRDL